MQFVLKCSLLVKIVCILLNIEQYLQTAFNVHNCQASLLVIFFVEHLAYVTPFQTVRSIFGAYAHEYTTTLLLVE